jgi:hypothetical protein
LLLALSMLFAASLLTVCVLDTTTLELAALRRQIAYEQALLMAQAAVHACVAELEVDANFAGQVAQGVLGEEGAYQATIADRDGDIVLIQGAGSAGGFTRRVTAKVQL